MSQILGWMCLVLVACTSAYGLQVTAAAMLLSADAARHVTSATHAREVLLVAFDPVTGDRAEVKCDVPSYSFTSDVHLVDANEFPAVVQSCNDRTARTTVLPGPTVRPTQGQPRHALRRLTLKSTVNEWNA